MYIVSLKQFDGPLDLLLTLITHAKVDIHDIFVSEITEQYLESMKLVDELDMDSASEFLQMAATLLEIKSRSMLPKPPKPEDENELSPEEALIRQLEEYRQFKEISGRMQELEKQARALITKLPEEYPLPPPVVEITGLTLDKLQRAGQDKGLTIVGLRMFLNERGLVKIVIGLARGRKTYDKREYLKENDAKREIDKAMKNYRR